MAGKDDKLVPVEVLPPEPHSFEPVPRDKKLEEEVRRQLAEALATRDDFLLEPWFRARRIAEEIRRLQFVPERKKWSAYYERWGCLRCGTKTLTHRSHGMCATCDHQVHRRLKETLRELRGEKEHPIARACEVCGQAFSAMTDAQWEHVRKQHERGQRHRGARREGRRP